MSSIHKCNCSTVEAKQAQQKTQIVPWTLAVHLANTSERYENTTRSLNLNRNNCCNDWCISSVAIYV